METQSQDTIRLVYPQWQGGKISQWIPEIKDPNESSRGYYLGAEILNFLAPKTSQKIITVPISTEIYERKEKDGIIDKDIIISNNKAALQILEKNDPKKIVVLGGECAVSVVPFTYLSKKYGKDLAMIWIDAHPDITLPGDPYPAFHAMAVAAIVGEGDKDIINGLPGKMDSKNVLLCGVRDWERDDLPARQKKLGIKNITREEILKNPDSINNWIKQGNFSKIVIHIDLDVLDPKEIICAVAAVPNGMKIEEVTKVINDISKVNEVVGITIAEHMPRNAIRLKKMLEQLPLLK